MKIIELILFFNKMFESFIVTLIIITSTTPTTTTTIITNTNTIDITTTTTPDIPDSLIHSPQIIPVYGQLLILILLAAILAAMFYGLRLWVIKCNQNHLNEDHIKQQLTYRRKRSSQAAGTTTKSNTTKTKNDIRNKPKGRTTKAPINKAANRASSGDSASSFGGHKITKQNVHYHSKQ